MHRPSVTLAIVLLAGACSPLSPATQLTEPEREAIADSIRAGVYAFAAAQENHEGLCEDRSSILEHFTYPNGGMLDASGTTPVFHTRAEWEATGLPTSYWCGIESLEFRIDSVVVHVLTRDVAMASYPHFFSRVEKSGDRYEARGNIFEAWIRTEEGWRASSGSGFYEEPDSL